MSQISFTVLGTPIAQGSKTRTAGGGFRESSKHLRPWRALVTDAAVQAMCELRPLTDPLDLRGPLTGPLTLNVTFRFKRPKKHFYTGKRADVLRADAPLFHITAPDVDKLVRSINDALADAGVMLNDSHVATVHARKVYVRPGELPGAYIVVEELDEYLAESA